MRKMLCAAALGFCLLLGTSSRVHPAGLSGKYDVRKIEFALDLRPSASRVRVTLATGQSLEIALTERETADRVLMMMGAVGQGARMAALVEDGQIRSLYLTCGPPDRAHAAISR
jgi:hypothetical protein